MKHTHHSFNIKIKFTQEKRFFRTNDKLRKEIKNLIRDAEDLETIQRNEPSAHANFKRTNFFH